MYIYQLWFAWITHLQQVLGKSSKTKGNIYGTGLNTYSISDLLHITYVGLVISVQTQFKQSWSNGFLFFFTIPFFLLQPLNGYIESKNWSAVPYSEIFSSSWGNLFNNFQYKWGSWRPKGDIAWQEATQSTMEKKKKSIPQKVGNKLLLPVDKRK